MKKVLSILALTALVSLAFVPGTIKHSADSSVTVYTTAKGTDLRISQNGQLSFKDFKQPLETQPTVFVDPAHTYQTFIGIGGALTDAAAETFAKLPKQQQEEFLTAQFDAQKGIGYTIGRTNINSCDF